MRLQVADRVLLVGPLPRSRREGVSTAFRDLVDGLEPQGAQCVNTNWMRDIEHPGRFNLLRAFESLAVALRILLVAWRYRTVYLIVSTSRFGFIRDALAVIAARLSGRRIVAHLHGGGMRSFYLRSGRLLRCLIRAVYGQTDRVIVLGERLRGQFRFLRRPGQVVVVANGLPADVQPVAEDRQLSQPLRLLYLSNLTPSKGIADLVRAAGMLGRDMDLELHVCGAFLGEVDSGGTSAVNDSFEKQVKRLVADSGIADRIHLHGTITGDAKNRLLADSHVFVLPTYYRWEGQPLSIIEAQASGLPVVTTDHRGIAETVNFGQSAEMCRPRDPDSIVTAIRIIVATPEVYRRYSEAARHNYLERFTIQAHIANMSRVLYENS